MEMSGQDLVKYLCKVSVKCMPLIGGSNSTTERQESCVLEMFPTQFSRLI